MALQDSVGTFLSVAQNRDKENLAGILAVASDLTGILVVIVGAGSVIKYGVTPVTLLTIGAMGLTSYVTKRLSTRYASRIKPE